MHGGMDLLRAVRLTVRDLFRQPGYTTAIVVTLALVIGANSAIFSAVHGVLLTPSAIRQPDNLVICWERPAYWLPFSLLASCVTFCLSWNPSIPQRTLLWSSLSLAWSPQRPGFQPTVPLVSTLSRF